jgi:hypothetical protein
MDAAYKRICVHVNITPFFTPSLSLRSHSHLTPDTVCAKLHTTAVRIPFPLTLTHSIATKYWTEAQPDRPLYGYCLPPPQSGMTSKQHHSNLHQTRTTAARRETQHTHTSPQGTQEEGCTNHSFIHSSPQTTHTVHPPHPKTQPMSAHRTHTCQHGPHAKAAD